MLHILQDLENCGCSTELITEGNILSVIKRNMKQVSSGRLTERNFDSIYCGMMSGRETKKWSIKGKKWRRNALAATVVETGKNWKS
jgi:hypothetical protein